MDADPDLTGRLVSGQAAGEAMVEQLMQDQPASATGWHAVTHLFDYNVDELEIGTIDAPEWKIEEPDKRFAARAVAGRGGLWGNHGYEAAYFLTSKDSARQPLDGNGRYELRLATPPPVDAFWSLTMYDVPRFYLVDNEIDRYSIGDRTAGLVTENGAVTVYLQRHRPSPRLRRRTGYPPPTGRSGRSCGCTSHSRPRPTAHASYPALPAPAKRLAPLTAHRPKHHAAPSGRTLGRSRSAPPAFQRLHTRMSRAGPASSANGAASEDRHFYGKRPLLPR